MQLLKRLFAGEVKSEEPWSRPWLPSRDRQLIGQKMNTIKILYPWREEFGQEGKGIWLFNDPTSGLVSEPFVQNASEVIDELVKIHSAIPDQTGRIGLMFSHVPFPNATKLILVEDSEGPMTGATYVLDGTKLEAWLCPALYHYFDWNQVPKELYAMAV